MQGNHELKNHIRSNQHFLWIFIRTSLWPFQPYFSFVNPTSVCASSYRMNMYLLADRAPLDWLFIHERQTGITVG